MHNKQYDIDIPAWDKISFNVDLASDVVKIAYTSPMLTHYRNKLIYNYKQALAKGLLNPGIKEPVIRNIWEQVENKYARENESIFYNRVKCNKALNLIYDIYNDFSLENPSIYPKKVEEYVFYYPNQIGTATFNTKVAYKDEINFLKKFKVPISILNARKEVSSYDNETTYETFREYREMRLSAFIIKQLDINPWVTNTIYIRKSDQQNHSYLSEEIAQSIKNANITPVLNPRVIYIPIKNNKIEYIVNGKEIDDKKRYNILFSVNKEEKFPQRRGKETCIQKEYREKIGLFPIKQHTYTEIDGVMAPKFSNDMSKLSGISIMNIEHRLYIDVYSYINYCIQSILQHIKFRIRPYLTEYFYKKVMDNDLRKYFAYMNNEQNNVRNIYEEYATPSNTEEAMLTGVTELVNEMIDYRLFHCIKKTLYNYAGYHNIFRYLVYNKEVTSSEIQAMSLLKNAAYNNPEKFSSCWIYEGYSSIEIGVFNLIQHMYNSTDNKLKDSYRGSKSILPNMYSWNCFRDEFLLYKNEKGYKSEWLSLSEHLTVHCCLPAYALNFININNLLYSEDWFISKHKHCNGNIQMESWNEKYGDIMRENNFKHRLFKDINSKEVEYNYSKYGKHPYYKDHSNLNDYIWTGNSFNIYDCDYILDWEVDSTVDTNKGGIQFNTLNERRRPYPGRSYESPIMIRKQNNNDISRTKTMKLLPIDIKLLKQIRMFIYEFIILQLPFNDIGLYEHWVKSYGSNRLFGSNNDSQVLSEFFRIIQNPFSYESKDAQEINNANQRYLLYRDMWRYGTEKVLIDAIENGDESSAIFEDLLENITGCPLIRIKEYIKRNLPDLQSAYYIEEDIDNEKINKFILINDKEV